MTIFDSYFPILLQYELATTEQLLESYPHLSPESIRACLLFAVDSIKNEIIHDIAA